MSFGLNASRWMQRIGLVILLIGLSFVSVFSVAHANSDDSSQVKQIKEHLLSLAESYKGQGDPDYSKQQALDVWVEKLLKASPQAPVAERLETLQGTWRQVWGPYDYRNQKRGVDPHIDPNHIYQVVRQGHYYNIASGNSTWRKSDKKSSSSPSLVLLRGEYRQVDEDPNRLNVKFTNLFKVSTSVPNSAYTHLADSVEQKTLARQNVIPAWVVRTFFDTGALNEVYTDETLRITYGWPRSHRGKTTLYVMTRVPQQDE